MVPQKAVSTCFKHVSSRVLRCRTWFLRKLCPLVQETKSSQVLQTFAEIQETVAARTQALSRKLGPCGHKHWSHYWLEFRGEAGSHKSWWTPVDPEGDSRWNVQRGVCRSRVGISIAQKRIPHTAPPSTSLPWHCRPAHQGPMSVRAGLGAPALGSLSLPATCGRQCLLHSCD